MSKINPTQLVFFFLLISFSNQICKNYVNHCQKCDPSTDLCLKCEKNIYIPDLNGGCEPSKQCIQGENFCNTCDQSNKLCSTCDTGFFPDQNGGCSTTENCIISYKGECLQCDEDFYLVGYNKYKFCLYKYIEGLQNCKTINYDNGLCESCNDGYFLNSVDYKCITTEFCRKSLFGVCNECYLGYFLDKRDDSCKDSYNVLGYCKISLDGEICDECNEDYYLSKNEKCVFTNHCSKADKNFMCQKCDDGYFLAEYNVCTNEKNCKIGDKDFGLCYQCINNNFYYDEDSKKCFSNQENNDFKFCEKVKSNKCTQCLNGYILGPDEKCSNSYHCLESKNGICIKCEENYHLGVDNTCTNIEKCIRTYLDSCIECEDNYYYDSYRQKCFLQINQFKNCQECEYGGEKCETCKKGYYLFQPKEICISNLENGPFYKCAISNFDGDVCGKCEDDYYLGSKDIKCTKIEGCAVSENENKCVECDEDNCLDVKKGTCIDNFYEPENEDKKIYYYCNKTNDEGTECALCKDDYFKVENGICVNKVECEKEENGKCVKCNEKSRDNWDMCLNNVYGCVETNVKNCLRCDNILDFDECTECVEGYELSDNNECVQF